MIILLIIFSLLVIFMFEQFVLPTVYFHREKLQEFDNITHQIIKPQNTFAQNFYVSVYSDNCIGLLKSIW